jgi:hypothetical protein
MSLDRPLHLVLVHWRDRARRDGLSCRTCAASSRMRGSARACRSFSLQGHAGNEATMAAIRTCSPSSKIDNVFSRWFGPKLSRLRTVAGANGMRIVIAVTIAGELVALLMTHFMPLPGFATPLP